jgi:hydroxymethylbilane synthase
MSQVGEERSTVVLGTRGSKLAVQQSEWVQAQLHALAPHVTVTLRRIQTSGDKILDVPLAQIGGKGLFVKEIEEALLSGEIDLAVHSMKDVPTELPEGLEILCVPQGPSSWRSDRHQQSSPPIAAFARQTGPYNRHVTRESGYPSEEIT